VAVTVQQTVSAVTVSPASASVLVGGTQQFSASAVDQFNQPLNPAPVFSFSVAGGGSISATGLFTAGSSAGGPFAVTAMAGGVGGGAQVTVLTGSAPTVATPAAASPSTVTGKGTALSVLGADDQGEAALIYTWSAMGPAPVVFSLNGSNAAKATTASFASAGTYLFTVVITDAAGLTAQSSVTVTVQPKLSRLAVTPGAVTVSLNGVVNFTAAGFDQFDSPLPASVTWSVSGGGTLSTTGVFTASTAGGPYTVTAASGSVFGFAQVTVKKGQGKKPRVLNLADGAMLSGNVALNIDAVGSGANSLAVTIDGQTVATLAADAVAANFDSIPLENGTRQLEVVALSDEGPLASDPITVVIDNGVIVTTPERRDQPVFGGCSATGGALGAFQLLALLALGRRRKP
jgi:uncharacterized protein (TIGR03382 family)